MNPYRRCQTRFRLVISHPRRLQAFHGWMTVAWGLAIPISVFTSLKTSLVWIVLMSAWANFASEFAAWQASRTETKLEEIN